MRHEHGGYGFFCGGDPRRFTPDGECTSDEERARHKAACEAWESAEKAGAERPASESDCKVIPGIGHAILSGFGPGVYTYDCDDPNCPESEPTQLDPLDANAAFQRWWDFDGQVEDANIPSREELARVALLAGFAAKEAAEEASSE